LLLNHTTGREPGPEAGRDPAAQRVAEILSSMPPDIGHAAPSEWRAHAVQESSAGPSIAFAGERGARNAWAPA